MTDMLLVKCDGCERTMPKKDSGGWYEVSVSVTSQSQLDDIQERVALTGTSGLLSGDFCSLRCLAEWALNAQVTQAMEEGLDDPPRTPRD